MNYLASPPLVVAYAIAGNMNVDLLNEPLGQDQDGRDVYMKDIWPTQEEIARTMDAFVTTRGFKNAYADSESSLRSLWLKKILEHKLTSCSF